MSACRLRALIAPRGMLRAPYCFYYVDTPLRLPLPPAFSAYALAICRCCHALLASVFDAGFFATIVCCRDAERFICYMMPRAPRALRYGTGHMLTLPACHYSPPRYIRYCCLLLSLMIRHATPWYVDATRVIRRICHYALLLPAARYATARVIDAAP